MDEPATILVVDDTPSNIRLLEAILEGDGHIVVGASSGQEALDTVRAGDVDLVLLDINMPGMNGHEVCRRIREADPTRLLPVVMVTAGADESTVTAIDAGADDFVTRPFDQAELLARVRSLLRIKQLHDLVEAQTVELSALNLTLEARVSEQLDELLLLRRLRRFLSPQLADVVLSAGDETLLETHRREIAVVFCDLRGFTRFAGAAEPEELIGVLGEFHRALGGLVARHGATVGHFAGDGVMLFFNDPVPCPDPALRAVTLSIELRDEVAHLREAWHRRGHDLDLGIGVELGFATLGTIGFEGRYDYSALGPVVNKASRLCAAAAAGEILIGTRALAAVDQLVDCSERAPIEAKGFPEPLSVWSVHALRPGTDVDLGSPSSLRTELRVLGPLEIVVDGNKVDIPASKERALLARLAVDANRVVSAERLVDDLWDGQPPESAATSLRVHVSRVRKTLTASGADVLIVTRSPGYALEMDPDAIDALRFAKLVSDGRALLSAGDADAAAGVLASALALWRGGALAEVAAAPSAAPEAARLDELRLAATEDRIEADLECGRHAALVGELQALVQEHPMRERLWGQLMLALYRSGRQADALRAFQDLRVSLSEEAGLEPSPALVRLEAALLAQDASLEV
ncbi:MAG: adenylate cyclase [Acidimicrobiaceae bacterium]